MAIPERLCHNFAKGDNFFQKVLASLVSATFQTVWATLEEKNLFKREQILSFKSSPQREEKHIFQVRFISFGGEYTCKFPLITIFSIIKFNLASKILHSITETF